MFFWDLLCTLSIFGIWPRFVEPKILCNSQLDLKIVDLPKELEGLKIFHFSDLHLSQKTGNRYLKRLQKRITQENPDVVVFTGDFLCYSKLDNKEKLKNFLSSIKAPYGCFAIAGNHDYAEAVNINSQGEYDVGRKAPYVEGIRRLVTRKQPPTKATNKVKTLPLNPELTKLLALTPFQLLHNQTITVPIKGSALNISGLGEYSFGQANTAETFANYDKNYPGLILLHNPDGVPKLSECPGNIILSGHTHGAQINLPFIWKKLSMMEHFQFKRGYKHVDDKHLYINRGVGAVVPLRFFAMPETTTYTLRKR